MTKPFDELARLAKSPSAVKVTLDGIPPNLLSRVMSHMGKVGGPRGGVARALLLSPERRSKIARKAAKKRWQKK